MNVMKRILAMALATGMIGGATTYTSTSAAILPSSENRYIGDVNFDGAIDASDASEVLSAYADLSIGKETDIDMVVADVTHDGVVNAADASRILEIYSYLATGQQVALEIICQQGIILENNESFKANDLIEFTGLSWYVHEEIESANDHLFAAKSTLNNGDLVTIISKEEDGWYKIRIGGRKEEAYILITNSYNNYFKKVGYVEWTDNSSTPATTTATEPVTTTVKTTAKPQPTTTKSVETTVKPKVTTTKLVETTVKPKVTTTKLVETTVKPKVTTTKLVATTAKPQVTTTKLVVTTEKPQVTTTKSVVTTAKPQPTTTKATTTIKPTTTTTTKATTTTTTTTTTSTSTTTTTSTTTVTTSDVITTTVPINVTTIVEPIIPETEYMHPVKFIGYDWNVRTSPEISRDNIIDWLVYGDIFYIKKPVGDDWYEIIKNNLSESIYVRVDDVNFEWLDYDTAVYFGEGRNVRSSMTLENNDNIIGRLIEGDVVVILERYDDGWYRVITNNTTAMGYQEAYVYGDVFSPRYRANR